MQCYKLTWMSTARVKSIYSSQVRHGLLEMKPKMNYKEKYI